MNKILIVEDDQMLVEIYQKKFETDGFDVETARDGSEAIKKIHKFEPDLVLLDLVMPEEDGFDVLKKINSTPIADKVKIVVFSNLSQDEDVEKAKRLGAIGFITKSDFTPHEVVKQVQELLGRSNDEVSKKVEKVSSQESAGGTKILLIEDDEVFSKVFSGKLEQSGYAVDVEKDCEKGLGMLREAQIDVCIIDCADVEQQEMMKIMTQMKGEKTKFVIFSSDDPSSNPKLFKQVDLVLDKTKITPGELTEKIGALIK